VFPTDPVVLFRFSALTFNGHRIHYDHPYATEVEGYPGLVVHAPLTALLLLDAAVRQRPEATPARFTYRAEGPLFCPEAITLTGRGEAGTQTELWAAAPDGRTAMKGMVEWAT
jgi:3-methylfumaryl-CoA hydratase